MARVCEGVHVCAIIAGEHSCGNVRDVYMLSGQESVSVGM